LRHGLEIPTFNLQAFSGEYFHFTLGGYVRILAVMTGIEVFANLVAAYEGTAEQKSRKAFNSLLIIMGTTAATMIVVGPAIFRLADPANEQVSVFTQTMDLLLPAPLPLFGTLIGIAVLMSASAASAQGLQNLALGLKERGYIPPALGQQNRFEVADKPVWIQVGIVVVSFVFFGTSEETYLALYAAGVFILLSMTAWAVTKRLLRDAGGSGRAARIGQIAGSSIAALLTTIATVLIFEERFFEGAWTYFVFIPLLYASFTYFRRRFGAPSPERDYIGLLNAAQLGGFGFGQSRSTGDVVENGAEQPLSLTWDPEPKTHSRWRELEIDLKKILVLLDGSVQAAQAVPMARRVARGTGAEIVLLSSVKDHTAALKEAFEATRAERAAYLETVRSGLESEGLAVSAHVRPGFIADATEQLVDELGIDLVLLTPRGKSGSRHWSRGGASHKIVRQLDVPILLVQDDEPMDGKEPGLDRILVSLDGSIFSEEVLPYARLFAEVFGSDLILLSVPAVPDALNYRAAPDLVERLRKEAVFKMRNFLTAVADSLRERGITVRTLVTGSLPEHTIITAGEAAEADLTMLTSQGRGGLDLLFTGSIAMYVVENSKKPVFIYPIRKMVAAKKEGSAEATS
ncbi:MAG TPA: universal stress protein, partial [Anaerolineales bacterium]|nr:universal stress protein [Anaerolineales bacterium]